MVPERTCTLIFTRTGGGEPLDELGAQRVVEESLAAHYFDFATPEARAFQYAHDNMVRAVIAYAGGNHGQRKTAVLVAGKD